jgi:hypothetical protein
MENPRPRCCRFDEFKSLVCPQVNGGKPTCDWWVAPQVMFFREDLPEKTSQKNPSDLFELYLTIKSIPVSSYEFIDPFCHILRAEFVTGTSHKTSCIKTQKRIIIKVWSKCFHILPFLAILRQIIQPSLPGNNHTWRAFFINKPELPQGKPASKPLIFTCL